MFGEAFYEACRLFGRTYVDVQQLRMAIEARLRLLKQVDDQRSTKIRCMIERELSDLKKMERELIREFVEYAGDHPIIRFCESVKGLGYTAALMFMSYINPYKMGSAGKVWAYAGLVPHVKRVRGVRANYCGEFKGKIWFATKLVIMRRDEYYYPLYQAKKEYYLSKSRIEELPGGVRVRWPPMREVVEDPSKCPRYQECIRMLIRKAERVGREPKKPPCKVHLNALATRWLAKLIVSHAWQVMREAEGLPVNPHRNFIRPKTDPKAFEELETYIRNIKNGLVASQNIT